MTMSEKVYAELKKRIEAAGFEAITLKMKCNGDEVTVTPCYYGKGTPKWEDIEYFLVDAGMVNLYGDEKLEKVADTIARYEDLLHQADEQIDQLKAYIRKHGEYGSDWSWVSDWHKDLFGHRPHVPTKQIIAWANSKYKGSARMFKMR